MKTVKYLLMGALAGLAAAALCFAVIASCEISRLESLPEVYECRYEGGYVKIFGFAADDGGKCVCIIHMSEKEHDSADEKTAKLMLTPYAMERYGQDRRLLLTPFFKGSGKYHVMVYQTKSAKDSPVVLNAKDFGFFEPAQSDNGPGSPAPFPDGMPPLEESGFPIIVK